ncbi:MAG: nucleotidyl transferase AbiEii/AbiGii toxin family protein [Candidatus Aquicultorales bacterium]
MAIQLGHRRSIDFDFFSTKPFSTETLIADLKADAIRFKVVAEEEGTLLLTVRGGKTSFFHDRYPLLEPTAFFEDIPLARIEDITAMKILAIVQRGAKRDFVDLFFILQEIPFHKIAMRIIERYGPERMNPTHVGKSLVYFVDAEIDPDPDYLPGFETDWKDVKEFFNGHVKQYVLDFQQAL